MPRGIPNSTPPVDRRRQGSTGGFKRKLAVDPSLLDPAYEHRWANDDALRLYSLTKEDNWDLVPDPSKSAEGGSTDMGSAISKVVGKNESGQPVRAYLIRRHKSFAERSTIEKREAINRTMTRMTGADERAKLPHSYGEGIRVEEGSKR